jgi:hypothetical protein
MAPLASSTIGSTGGTASWRPSRQRYPAATPESGGRRCSRVLVMPSGAKMRARRYAS